MQEGRKKSNRKRTLKRCHKNTLIIVLPHNCFFGSHSSFSSYHLSSPFNWPDVFFFPARPVTGSCTKCWVPTLRLLAGQSYSVPVPIPETSSEQPAFSPCTHPGPKGRKGPVSTLHTKDYLANTLILFPFPLAETRTCSATETRGPDI